MDGGGHGGLDAQTAFWNGAAAAAKTFTHPLPLHELLARLAPGAAVLDYGCGYGRLCAELAAAGLDATGVDISEALVRRGLDMNPSLRLRPFDGLRAPFPDAAFDACLLVAVLNCIPTDAGLERALAEVRRLLRPGGLLFVSDYPLQTDARNRLRYEECAAEFGVYGTFRADGAVFRHFGAERLDALLAPFETIWRRGVRVRTMNGHESDVVQLIARKPGA